MRLRARAVMRGLMTMCVVVVGLIKEGVMTMCVVVVGLIHVVAHFVLVWEACNVT